MSVVESSKGDPLAATGSGEPPRSSANLVERLCAQAVRTVGEVLPAEATQVALLDFPYHRNAGDSAIWLGEVNILDQLGVRIAYQADSARYHPDRLREAVPSGPILLSGGGNFGDLWPVHQRLRMQVLKDFPDREIIQLPQSIEFKDPDEYQAVARVVDAHPNLTLMVREHRSLKLAEEHFDAPVVLCPDMAFGLGVIAPPPVRAAGVLCLARSDKEGTGVIHDVVGPGIRHADWALDGLSEIRWTAARTGPRLERGLLREHGRARRAARRALDATYSTMAHTNLNCATRLLAGASYVVTDRLHAHVLSVLLGIPHCVLDNNYGKIRGVYDAWTAECDLVDWATTSEDALAYASRYLP